VAGNSLCPDDVTRFAINARGNSLVSDAIALVSHDNKKRHGGNLLQHPRSRCDNVPIQGGRVWLIDAITGENEKIAGDDR